MRSPIRLFLLALALALAGCQPVLEPPRTTLPHKAADIVTDVSEPAVELAPTPAPAPDVPEAGKPTIADPPPPTGLTRAGFQLITEYEGWAGRPELPDLRYSGISWAWGYDAHQNSKSNILMDWRTLPAPQPARLAATQPFYGRSAVQSNKDVHDIVIPRLVGDDVFIRVDMARTYAQCRHAFPEFDGLRPNAQSAIASLVFNRGSGLSGPSRSEMRTIHDLVPSRDYEGIAIQFRKMVRVWAGTSIEAGMRRRRLAEANLVLTP